MESYEQTNNRESSRNTCREALGQSIDKKSQKEPPKSIYLPSFHVANIQNLLPKPVREKNELFVKHIEKINFLREQSKEENPYFMAFAETHLKEDIKEAEFEMEGYSHVTSHRKNRIGGGVIIYISNKFTYQTLFSNSDEMCSMVAIYINELNLIVFMVYRPPQIIRINSTEKF